MKNNELVIGVTGASGTIFAYKLLNALRDAEIRTHLIMSSAALITMKAETDFSTADFQALASYNHNIHNISATIASGSYKTMGMVIVPCSIKTMSEIASGVTSNLISRAADVVLKERRKLVLMVRETPFHSGHLRNMLQLSEMGAIIAPPIPAFYHRPKDIDEMINHSVSRILDLFDIEHDFAKRWGGLNHK